jgi:hypothetical protein
LRERDGAGLSVADAGRDAGSRKNFSAGRGGSGTEQCGTGRERDENSVPRRALVYTV